MIKCSTETETMGAKHFHNIGMRLSARSIFALNVKCLVTKCVRDCRWTVSHWFTLFPGVSHCFLGFHTIPYCFSVFHTVSRCVILVLSVSRVNLSSINWQSFWTCSPSSSPSLVAPSEVTLSWMSPWCVPFQRRQWIQDFQLSILGGRWVWPWCRQERKGRGKCWKGSPWMYQRHRNGETGLQCVQNCQNPTSRFRSDNVNGRLL